MQPEPEQTSAVETAVLAAPQPEPERTPAVAAETPAKDDAADPLGMATLLGSSKPAALPFASDSFLDAPAPRTASQEAVDSTPPPATVAAKPAALNRSVALWDDDDEATPAPAPAPASASKVTVKQSFSSLFDDEDLSAAPAAAAPSPAKTTPPSSNKNRSALFDDDDDSANFAANTKPKPAVDDSLFKF